jgi:hypothetical protein
MTDQFVMLIERLSRKQFSKFIEMFKNRQEIPIKEIRKKIPKSTFYDFILNKVYRINHAIKTLNNDNDGLLIPALIEKNGKVTQCFKRNGKIKIVDEDPYFFYLILQKDNTSSSIKSEGKEDGQN